MRSYRDVEKRLAALEAKIHTQAVLDVRMLSDAELERMAEDIPPEVRAVIERMSDAELERVSGMRPAEAEACIDRKIREGAA